MYSAIAEQTQKWSFPLYFNAIVYLRLWSVNSVHIQWSLLLTVMKQFYSFSQSSFGPFALSKMPGHQPLHTSCFNCTQAVSENVFCRAFILLLSALSNRLKLGFCRRRNKNTGTYNVWLLHISLYLVHKLLNWEWNSIIFNYLVAFATPTWLFIASVLRDLM